jgi:hypothetical protein
MHLRLNPVEESIIEELIFHGHFLTVVKHLEQEVRACSREELLDVLGLVLAHALETPEGLLVLDATTRAA